MLKVPLSPDQLQDALSEAKHWFAARKGVDKEIVLHLASGQVEYDMPSDCDAVIDVAFQTTPYDISLAFAPGILADERIPYNAFIAPSTAGPYSSFVQAMQYTEQVKRLIGAEPNFQYFPYKNKLLLLPDTKGSIAYALVQYKSSSVTSIEQLPERDHDLIKRFAAAWAKRDLGAIYSRYAVWPGAENGVQLNGPALLAEADLEFKKLELEISNSAMPMPWVTG